MTKEQNLKRLAKSKIQWILDASDIDQAASQSILVNAFSTEYRKYLKPEDVDSPLKCWTRAEGLDSVEEYYEKYFKSELAEFQAGHLLWFQAKIENQVVGFSTFELEPDAANSVYMNLLVVDPKYQGLGIGRDLVFIVQNLEGFRKVDRVSLLLRKTNQAGRKFYSHLNFKLNPSYTRLDNFVDPKLLEPWTYTTNKNV